MLARVSGLEREFKLRLPGAAHAAVARRFADWPAARVRQTNHFFDTAGGALRAARLALRLREEDGRFALALKGPELPAAGGLAVRAEVERALGAAEARAVLAGERAALDLLAEEGGALVAEARARVAGQPLLRIGGFENERLRLGPRPFPAGAAPVVLELDRTRFPDGTLEHELELELPEGADPAALADALQALCAELGIPFESAPSKAARCFRILDELAQRGAAREARSE